MKKLNFDFGLEGEGLYNIRDVLDNFSTYFGSDFRELSFMFYNYPLQLIESNQLREYVENNLSFMEESRFQKDVCMDAVMKRVMRDYQYFEKKLSILSNKGLQFLDLLCYLTNLQDQFKEQDCYEKQLKILGIFHYNSVMIGKDIQTILVAFGNLLKQFFECLEKMNRLETYHTGSIDSFAVHYGAERIYPCPSLVLENSFLEENVIDKTSIIPKKRFVRKKTKCY